MQISGFLIVTGTDFVDNTAVLNGGGVAAGGIILRDGRFEGNLSETGFGGGLSTAYALIADTVFISNTSLHSGGGLRIFGIGGSIVASRFENNRTTGSTYADGGGLDAFASTVGGESIKITDTQFINNIAATNGGGLALYSDINDPSRIVNSLFASNHTGNHGAAIYLNSPSTTTILHKTIADVQHHPHSAIAIVTGTVGITNSIIVTHGVAIHTMGGNVYEDYNLFFQNKGPDLVGVTSGGHSLVGDPKFVDPLNGDYHLQFGSAAIDHGVDAGVYTDLDGNLRPIGLGFDIGAYEYQGSHYLWLPLIRK